MPVQVRGYIKIDISLGRGTASVNTKMDNGLDGIRCNDKLVLSEVKGKRNEISTWKRWT